MPAVVALVVKSNIKAPGVSFYVVTDIPTGYTVVDKYLHLQDLECLVLSQV